MPPSMQKSDCTSSVRDRVLAIERSHIESENSIIRARYVPDVRGVNRYKHFHVVNKTTKNPRQEKTIHKEIITDLPQLSQSTRTGAVHHFITESDDNGVEKGKRSKKSILPQLGTVNLLTKTQKEKSISDYISQETKSELTSSDSLSLSTATTTTTTTTTRPMLSARKLHDRLLSIHHQQQQQQQQTILRTFASFGAAKDGITNICCVTDSDDITNSDGTTNDAGITNNDGSTNNELSEVIKLPDKIQETTTLDPKPRTVEHQREDTQHFLVRNRMETATQTQEEATTTNTHSTQVGCYGEGRSTQTDSYPIVVNLPRCKNSEVVVNLEDIEEREVLYQVIENALGETIDRYSRLRTNQIIANSARKQGQIWRDAKDFIANQLVPQSIQLASKSQSRRRTAVEIITSIRSFP
ncbi:hypothetical protein Angca_001262 [Angiostrongylus cantonensis]|nr:hypothetical protein Angca_001262 [Angiostrongylus cantonensis]